MPKKRKAGKFFAEGVLEPERVHSAGIVALYERQGSVDPMTGLRCLGVDAVAVRTALREMTAEALAPGAGTELIERALLASAAMLGNLSTVWTATAVSIDSMSQLEIFARLALKAQDQQRKTLATLAEIRNPKRAQFIKQLNQAVNQQVNNATDPVDKSLVAAETGKFLETEPTELLTVISSERLDTGATPTTSGRHPSLEALAAQHWPENAGRQSEIEAKRPEARPTVAGTS